MIFLRVVVRVTSFVLLLFRSALLLLKQHLTFVVRDRDATVKIRHGLCAARSVFIRFL